MADEYKLVKAALNSFGEAEAYLIGFKAARMDDQSLSERSADPEDMRAFVSDVISLVGHRVKFVAAFKRLQCNYSITDTLPASIPQGHGRLQPTTLCHGSDDDDDDDNASGHCRSMPVPNIVFSPTKPVPPPKPTSASYSRRKTLQRQFTTHDYESDRQPRRELSTEELKKKILQDISVILDEFHKDMSTKIEDKYIKDQGLVRIHRDTTNKATSALSSLLKDYPSYLSGFALDHLDAGLSIESWKSKVSVQNKQIELEIRSDLMQAQNHYMENMDPYQFESTQEFTNAHDQLKRKCLDILHRSKHLNESNSKEWENQLSSAIDRIYVTRHSRFTKSRRPSGVSTASSSDTEADGLEISKLILEAVQMYKRDAREHSQNALSTDDFKLKMAVVEQELEDWLAERCKNSPTTFHSVLNEWKVEAEKAELDVLKAFSLRQRLSESAILPLLDALKTQYKTDMNIVMSRNNWVTPEVLRREHDRVMEKLLLRAKETKTLTLMQENKIVDTLNLIYLQYDEENHRRAPTVNVAIGIDLGTTYSCVGFYEKGKVEIIRDFGIPTVPSVVAFEENHHISVGEQAKDCLIQFPEHTVFDAKRLIGRKFTDRVIQEDIKLWPFELKEVDKEPRIVCRGKLYRPEEISAKILYRLKQLAEKHLDRPVVDAVVTIPAYFTDSQRQATRDAAEIAGLKVNLLTEPVAAAVAYGLHRQDEAVKNVLVFDLGGGTFDVAVIQINMGEIHVQAIDGNSHLGGEDFDNAILQYVIDVIRKDKKVDLTEGKNSPDPQVRKEVNGNLRRIRTECERKKRFLSLPDQEEVEIQVQLTRDRSQHDFLKVPLTRSKFEQMILPMLQECMEILSRCLDESKVHKNDINDIILVGGSTHIPKVRELLSEFFDGKPLRQSVNADEAVAQGASIEAALRNGKKGQIRTDVLPLSIGIEREDGRFVVQIPKNTKLPCSHTSVWENARDYQENSTYYIYSGECCKAADNHFLGKFLLTGIPRLKKGMVKKDITTWVDEEGIVRVRAVCRANNQSSEIKVLTDKGRFSKDEINAHKTSNLLKW